MEPIGGLKYVDFMNRLLFLLGLVVTINSFSQPPVSTTELQFTSTASFSTTNGRIRYNSACNCFVFRYGGANVTPPLVAAPGVGQAGQSVRWNNGTTSWEYFTPSSGTVNSVTGTSNRITIGGTAADPTVDIASNYLGQNTITTLGTITTGVWTGTDVAYANIAQGSALSVLGVAGNATADNASIAAGSDKQIMRREGTALAFGSIDLSASGAVGSSILGIANGGTGSSSQAWWALSGTSTLAGSTTITSSAANQHNFNGTWTASANDQFHFTLTGALTARATASDRLTYLIISPSLVAAASSQRLVAVDINPTFNQGAFGGVNDGLLVRSGRVGFGLGSTSPTGSLHIKTSGTTSSTTALHIQNSNNDAMFRILDDARVRVGNAGSPANIGSTSNGTSFSNSGEGLMISTSVVGTTIECTANSTAGDLWKVRTHGSHTPSSASTATFRDIYSTTTFDFTSAGAGATAIGFDWNPTLTSVTTAYGIRIQPTAALNGFATATPTSTLESGRSFGAAITSTSSDITLDASHYTLQVDATGANRTETLPAASTCTRRIYVILKIDASANTVTIDGNGGETISGAATQVITTQWKGYMIQSTGSAWVIISAF